MVPIHGRHRWGPLITVRSRPSEEVAANASVQVTWKIGADTVVRPQFEANQTLDNTQDTNYRAINDNW